MGLWDGRFIDICLPESLCLDKVVFPSYKSSLAVVHNPDDDALLISTFLKVVDSL